MHKIKNSFYLTSILSLLFSSYVVASDEEYDAGGAGSPYGWPAASPSFCTTPPEGGEGAVVDDHLVARETKDTASSPSVGRSNVSEEVVSPSRGGKGIAMVIRLTEKNKVAPGGSGSTGSNESPKGVVDLIVETFGIDVPFVLPADGEGDKAVPQAPVTPAAKVKTLGVSKKRPLSDRPSGFKAPRRIQPTAVADGDRDVGQAAPKRMAVAAYVPHENDPYVVAAIKTLSGTSGLVSGGISYITVEKGNAVRFTKDDITIDLHLNNRSRLYNFTKVDRKYEGVWEQSDSFETLDEAVNHILRYLRTAI